MSIFGTLGKKGRRKNSVSNHGLSGLKDPSQSSSSSLFKSTPNLYNLDGASGSSAADITDNGTALNSLYDSPSGLIYYDYEKNPRTPCRKIPNHERDSDRGGGGGSPRHASSSTSSLSSVSHSIGSEDAKPEFSTPKSPFSAFRGIVTMVSTASGVKKTKSIRRKAFASSTTTHNKNTDHSLRDVEGVIHEDIAAMHSSFNLTTPPRRSFSSHRSASIKSSHSVPNMENGSKGQRFRSCSSDDVVGIGIRYNGEPGVESSSTSLSSAGTNPSVSENDSYASSRSRCPSVAGRSDNFDPESSQNDPEIERRKLMLQAAKKFNMDPKKGIDFLILNGLLERTPESIAQFLKHGEQLSKSAIGNYLGEHHEFNLEVLNCFVELHDFTNVLLVEALRQFLWSFRLPGEAQKIDRMMECFAKRYTLLNPTLFTNSDTCYLLSFAIIMLNTSLHNPNVKDKPSLEQFIQMNRDIDAGQPLERKFITSLYNSILTQPFEIPPEDGNDLMLTFFNPAIEGWLWKQGGRYKTWKRRWFILSNNCLYYFLFTTDKDPRGIIPLENIGVKKAPELGKEFCFTLYKATNDPKVTDYIKSCKASDGKLTAGKHVRYHLATKTKEDRDRWITAISQNSSDHNFYNVLAQKKHRLEAQQRGGTVKRNQTLLQSPKGIPIGQSPGAVRKSQIGLPITRSDLAKSFNHIPYPDLLSPDPTLGRDPHEYFASTTSSTSNLAYDGSGEYFGHSEDEAIKKIDESKPSSTVYSTQSLPRTKSKKKGHGHFHAPPLRKFSLPPETLPSRLVNKVEYLTSSGIRISIEDAENKRSSVEDTGSERCSVGGEDNEKRTSQQIDDGEVILSEHSQTAKYSRNVVADADSEIENSPSSDVFPVIEEDDQLHVDDHPVPASTVPTETDDSRIPETPLPEETNGQNMCTSSLILALKDFANVMENLNLEDKETRNDGEWAEMDELSVEDLHYSGLTKQCLRSSFKSKRSRYRNKHRKFPSSEAKRKSTVISVGSMEDLEDIPVATSSENVIDYPPFEISIVEHKSVGERELNLSSDKEIHSEV